MTKINTTTTMFCNDVTWANLCIVFPLLGELQVYPIHLEALMGKAFPCHDTLLCSFFVTVWENTVEWSVFCDAMAPTWYLVTDQTLTFTIFSAWSTHLETRIISSIISYLYMVWQKCAVLHPLGPRIWDFNCNHTMSNTFRKKNNM